MTGRLRVSFPGVRLPRAASEPTPGAAPIALLNGVAAYRFAQRVFFQRALGPSERFDHDRAWRWQDREEDFQPPRRQKILLVELLAVIQHIKLNDRCRRHRHPGSPWQQPNRKATTEATVPLLSVQLPMNSREAGPQSSRFGLRRLPQSGGVRSPRCDAGRFGGCCGSRLLASSGSGR